ncbi:MAG: hypothetical protein V3U92_04295 [Cellulophaga sp.]
MQARGEIIPSTAEYSITIDEFNLTGGSYYSCAISIHLSKAFK